MTFRDPTLGAGRDQFGDAERRALDGLAKRINYSIVDATSDIRAPYKGQKVFDRTTSIEYVYSGTAWVQVYRLGAWTAFSSVPTPSAGTFTTATGAGTWTRHSGRVIEYRYVATITTVGTGSGDCAFTLPVAPASSQVMGYGRENAATGDKLIVYSGGGSVANISGTTLASARTLSVAGTYEAAS